MQVRKIFVGSWFQRTTLHLSEVLDFLKGEESPLEHDQKKLSELREALELGSVEDVRGDLEYVQATGPAGISFKFFEDGLIALAQEPTTDVVTDIERLTNYYEVKLAPAIKYLFSLGAPIPKELANIKNVYPYFLVIEDAQNSDIVELFAAFKQEKHFEIRRDMFEIFRGDSLYIIHLKGATLEAAEQFIQERIFIREFKSQLHRYLNLHRLIWENIAEVKERGTIRGKDVGDFKKKVERYAKTVSMIATRIEQMGAYIGTRASIAKKNPDMQTFIEVMDFKHETLENTLSYVKDIWDMTANYVDSALKVFSDLQDKATDNSIRNLTVVTSMGVGGTLLGLFAKTELPELTVTGVYYFLILAAIGWAVNLIMKAIALNRTYKVKNIKADRDIA